MRLFALTGLAAVAVVLALLVPASAQVGGAGGYNGIQECLSPGGGTITGDLHANDDVQVSFGNTDAAPDYWWTYDSANTQYELNSTDCNGSGTDCVVAYVNDGTASIEIPAGALRPRTSATVALSAGGTSSQYFAVTTGANPRVQVDNGSNLSIAGIVHQDSVPTVTLAAAAATFVATRNVNVVDCDVGGNTIATITGDQAGMVFCMHFVDASCTVTDTAAATADTVNLSAAFTSSADDVLCLVHNGTKWYETSRAVN
jgi:hypothetical protein